MIQSASVDCHCVLTLLDNYLPEDTAFREGEISNILFLKTCKINS